MCFEDGGEKRWLGIIWSSVYVVEVARRGIREGLVEGIDRMGMVERSELLRGWEHPAGKKRGYLEKKIKIDRLDLSPFDLSYFLSW